MFPEKVAMLKMLQTNEHFLIVKIVVMWAESQTYILDFSPLIATYHPPLWLTQQAF